MGGYYDTPQCGHWSLVKLPGPVSLFWASFFGKKVRTFSSCDRKMQGEKIEWFAVYVFV